MNTNVQEIKEIIPPHTLRTQFSLTEDDAAFVAESRRCVERILLGHDKRFLVIVGPCSIHDYAAALEYAKLLARVQEQYQNLYIVMRVYFEKPRSRTGWKGFIYDPGLDESFAINKGLELARRLLLEITRLKIPIGCEFLDTITPQYLSDLVSWGAIGARTSESQIHRQLASGLSMPIGFKNLTSGDYKKAIDGIISAQFSHNFLGIDDEGKVAHVITRGNQFGHLILRGGSSGGPNYDQPSVDGAVKALWAENLKTGLIIDCSHGNSEKDYNRQILVALQARRLWWLNRCDRRDEYPVRGIMLESNINKGSQKISANMQRGVSITDACIDFPTTEMLLSVLNSLIVDTYSYELAAIRKKIREYDLVIYNILLDTFTFSERLCEGFVGSDLIFNEDYEIAKLCKGRPREEMLLTYISIRLAHSEAVARFKFDADPFKFLNKRNDFLKEVTDREIEKWILRDYKDPIYLKIMDLSKNIQVKYLETYTKSVRIGYLFGEGTFSHEAITENFRGVHVPFASYEELVKGIRSELVDFILVPTYNSIIGEIFEPAPPARKLGSIDHKIELNLYCTEQELGRYPVFFLEPHIRKEAHEYLSILFMNKVVPVKIVTVKSSIEGCKSILDKEQYPDCFKATIASAKNECNLYYTLDRDIVKHNVTTFSLFG